MDEITLFATLAPARPAGYEAGRARIRPRLDAELARARASGATAPRGRAARGLRRRVVLTAAAVAVAGTAVVAPALLPAGGNVPMVTKAWAVTRHGDGTVTVAFRYVADLPGLQRALAAAGVPAIVRPTQIWQYKLKGVPYEGAVCNYRPTARELEPASIRTAVIHHTPAPGRDITPALGHAHVFEVIDPYDLVIRPSAMPAGSVLFLNPVDHLGVVGWWEPPTVLRHDRVPACVPPPLGW